jgi:hypothetical protein
VEQLQPMKNFAMLAQLGSWYSQLLGPPGSRHGYFPKFQIIKTSLKGSIIKKLLHLSNLQPYEMKFIFKNYTTKNPSDRLPDACTSGESTLKGPVPYHGGGRMK